MFRIYDKEGLGYITTETLRGLIGELLAPLTGRVAPLKGKGTVSPKGYRDPSPPHRYSTAPAPQR